MQQNLTNSIKRIALKYNTRPATKIAEPINENLITSILLGSFGVIMGGSLYIDQSDIYSKNQTSLRNMTKALSGISIAGSAYYLIKFVKK
jgi:hypothetical protein